MTRRTSVGFLIVCTVMASSVLASPGAEVDHFQAMRLTRLDPAVALPDKRVTNLEGREVALHSFRGKVLLINFWTTW